MRIMIERRGGLAGRRAFGEREESELTPDERAALQGLLRSPPEATPAPGADRFHFTITVEDEGGTRRLDIPEHAMPEALAAIPVIRL